MRKIRIAHSMLFVDFFCVGLGDGKRIVGDNIFRFERLCCVLLIRINERGRKIRFAHIDFFGKMFAPFNSEEERC